MMQRSWRYVVAALLVLAVILGGGYWYWNRPAPQPTLEQLEPADGVPMTRVVPGTKPRAQVLVAVNEDQKLSDTQLTSLSRSGSAEIVQVILPKDCMLQGRALQAGLRELHGPATLVSGIGPGAVLAWRWLAEQKDDKARAVSVDLALEKPGCTHLLPKSAAHGRWLVAWNDNPDDTSAGFVRDQSNAETSISDYDINLPQVLNNELRKILVGADKGKGGLSIPVVEVPASQARDTVTLFLSGDGGWRDLDRDVADEMAKVGYPVVGIDTLRYYWQHKSPEQSAADLTELMQHYRQVWGTKRFHPGRLFLRRRCAAGDLQPPAGDRATAGRCNHPARLRPHRQLRDRSRGLARQRRHRSGHRSGNGQAACREGGVHLRCRRGQRKRLH